MINHVLNSFVKLNEVVYLRLNCRKVKKVLRKWVKILFLSCEKRIEFFDFVKKTKDISIFIKRVIEY